MPSYAPKNAVKAGQCTPNQSHDALQRLTMSPSQQGSPPTAAELQSLHRTSYDIRGRAARTCSRWKIVCGPEGERRALRCAGPGEQGSK